MQQDLPELMKNELHKEPGNCSDDPIHAILGMQHVASPVLRDHFDTWGSSPHLLLWTFFGGRPMEWRNNTYLYVKGQGIVVNKDV